MLVNDLNFNSQTGKPRGMLLQYLPFAFICLIALALFVRHLLVFERGISFIASQVTIDDTYYYLNTAWNQRHLGFTTFDGINKTNGVQFLWYWILVIFSYFFETRESFLYGSLVLCAVLSILAIFSAYRLGQVLDLGWKAVIPAVAVAGLVGYNKTLIVGLENTIHLLLFILLIIEYCKFLHSPIDTKFSAPRYLRITCLLGLITWARLDNAPISAILFGYATFEFWRANRERPQFYLRRIMLSSALIAVSAFIMFYGFYLMGGSLIPVSGLWKARSPEDDNLFGVFSNIWQVSFQRVFPLEHILSERWREVLAVVLSIMFLVVLIARYRLAPAMKKPLLRGLIILLLGTALHEMIMVYRLPAIAVMRGFWYLTPQFVMVIIMVSLLIHWLPEIIASRNPNIQQRLSWILPALFVVNTLVFSLYKNKGYLTNSNYNKFHSKRVEVALWLKKNLPSGTRLASLNSGELGFFSHRPMTNLDGLINSYEYFKFRKNGGGIREFCEMQGIDYFVDYMIPEDIKNNSEIVQTFDSTPALQLLRLIKHTTIDQTKYR